jgi:hypothetical protein
MIFSGSPILCFIVDMPYELYDGLALQHCIPGEYWRCRLYRKGSWLRYAGYIPVFSYSGMNPASTIGPGGVIYPGKSTSKPLGGNHRPCGSCIRQKDGNRFWASMNPRSAFLRAERSARIGNRIPPDVYPKDIWVPLKNQAHRIGRFPTVECPWAAATTGIARTRNRPRSPARTRRRAPFLPDGCLR